METKSNQLPEMVINEEVRKAYQEQIDSLNAFINGTLRQALDEEEIPFSVETLNALKSKENAINELIEKEYQKYLKTLSFVPKQERIRIEANFLGIAERLAEVCLVFYHRWQNYSYTLQQASGEIVLSPKEVKAHIEKLGVHIFSDKEKEYYSLIVKAADAIKLVQAFEIANGLPEYSTRTKIDFVSGGQLVSVSSGLAYDTKQGKITPEWLSKGLYSCR